MASPSLLSPLGSTRSLRSCSWSSDAGLFSPPLGATVDVTEAMAPFPVAKFRLEFTHDVRAKEMRWVLFTSTKRGAIGKLIFTLHENRAHVKSIAVNKEWRGRGLARVLYLACLSTLAELRVEELQLEAEEDTRRHGKLVGLYRSWGFHEVADAKVLFLYNHNDCFRKVPMSLSFRARDFFPVAPSRDTWFCMLTLTTTDGSCLIASENGAIVAKKEKSPEAFWQTLLGKNGEIFLRSVHGKFLCVEDSGTVLADRPWHSTWETFQVVPFHDEVATDDEPSTIEGLEEELEEDRQRARSRSGSGGAGGVALKDFHGSYLCIDSEKQQVVSSRVPVPWDGGDIMSLVCNKTDTKPMHVKIMRKYQTRAFVTQQTAKYSTFQYAAMGIPDAIEALMVLTGDSDAPSQSWLLHHVLASAEAARDDGHPDWFQLILFLRGLGMLFLLWTDDDNAILRSISASEWMLLVSTWVVGERIPDKIEFPELNELNPDHVSAEKEGISSALAGAGMENVLLPWTPDEYLFRVLQHNQTSLPAEALLAVRFWSLRLWFRHNCYSDVCAPQDLETKEWLLSVSRYAELRAKEKMKTLAPETLMPYYLGLAQKYLPPVLHW
ncbi:hypothetical protein P43SY_008000 [Pythium insidiosum]|uniref:Inositol oxygenase n=1 Tax=Pythium insidiosum TaxID=114742 RepID=A0AAD5QDV0_PYTIN|nr:hypothetical protein P43SY_008000 [Pythium insidiosum]